MSRRSLFSDRSSLSRRVLNLMSSVFRRRWGVAAARRSGRLASRMQEWMESRASAAAKVVNSHLLTLKGLDVLGAPEHLEPRAMMAVTANLITATDTLAVWMDADNDQTYIRQLGDGAGARLQISTDPLFSKIDVYNGTVPARLYVYDGANITMSLASGGSGYTTAPTISISNTSFGAPLYNTLNATSTLSANSVGTLGGSGFGAAAGSTTVVGFQNGSSVSVTLNWNATGVVTSSSLNTNGSRFTSLATSAFAWQGLPVGATLTGSLFGSVTNIWGTLSGQGYYRNPQISFSGSPYGATASATLAYTSSGSWANTGVTTDLQSGQLLSDLRVGQFYSAGGVQNTAGGGNTSGLISCGAIDNQFAFGQTVRYDSVDSVTLSAGTLGQVWVDRANNIDMRGNMSAAAETLCLSLRSSATGTINIGSTVSASQIDLIATGSQNVTVQGAATSATSTTVRGGNIAFGSSFTSGTTFYSQADDNISVSGPISTGAAATSWVLIQANNGTLSLDSSVTSSSGTITLSGNTITGPGLITGRSLTVQEGGGSGDYTLNANVSNFAGNSASNLTFFNARDLNIGQGALNMTGPANTLLLSSTGNLNVAANLIMASGGNVSLAAGKAVTVTGTIIRGGSALDLTINAANGAVSATSGLDLGTGNLVLSATGNVDIPSLKASRLNATTVTGNLNITEVDGVLVDNASVTNTGNILLTTLAGDIGIEGVSRISGAGTATFQSNKGNIVLNGSAFTNSTGSLVLNAANGTITNGATGSLATGTLTWIATTGAGAALLSNDTISNYSTLNANITGSGNALQVSSGRSLTLGSIVTKSGAIDVSVSNAASPPNLTISGSVSAGNTVLNTLQNITFSAPNGAITSTGLITGNVLTLSALNSTTLANQNINQLNASISGTGQNLTITSSRSLNAGNINLSGGTLLATLTAGNLTRNGTIDTGTDGTAILNVPNGYILGTGLINSTTLNFAAMVTPDLTVANATFTKLSANVTASGNINLVRNSDLQIDQALTSFGDVNINLAGGGNITINGPLTAGGSGGNNGNITLNAALGSVITSANAPGNLTANVLSVTSLGDLSLQTSVNALNANVTGTSGNITVVEKNGLIVGTSGINAANNITVTLLAGDLIRTGAINTSTSSGNVTLNITAGGVIGTGAINAATLDWTSKSAAAINDSFLTFSNIAANVTGAGNDLTIARLGNFSVLNATTASGNVAITSTVGGNVTTGNIALTGVVTAGGGKNVTLTATGGNVSSANSSSIVNTTGNVVLVAKTSSTLFTNITGIAANVTAGDLTVTESNGLTVLSGAGNNINAAGNVTLNVGNSVPGNLNGAGTINASGNVTISAPNGAVTLSSVAGQISASNLSITANATSSANTNVTNLTANVANGGLTIVDVDSIAIEPTDVLANGAVSITSTSGSIASGASNAVINAGTGNVTLSAANGAITFNSAVNQVAGNVLTITASSASALNTAVTTLVAKVTAGGLTVNEADDLVIGTSALTNVTTAGNLNLTLANGSLTGSGLVNASTNNVTINASQGGVTLNTSASQIRGNVLTINTAQGPVNVNTAVNAVVINVTGEGNGVVVSQTGNLAINGGDIRTANGSIAVATTGNLSRTNEINAGGGNVTLTAGGAINGTGLITGNVLTVSAASTSTLNTTVNAATATVTSNLSGLTITESDELAVYTGGIVTNNGAVSIALAGDLTGNAAISAGTANVTLNTTGGGVNLSATAGQVSGNVLNLVAQNTSVVSTNVAQLAANITSSGESLTVVEVNNLAVAAAGVVTTDGDVSLTATLGDINGTGTVNAGLGDVNLTAAFGGVNLALTTSQVTGTNLAVVARNASNLTTNVTNLTATISAGGLTIVDADDLTIEPTDVTAAGAVALTSTAGSLLGGATAGINAGGSNVTLTALSGNVTLNSAPNQIIAGTLTVAARDASAVNTSVGSLVANITAGSLTVVEANSLNIGISNISVVNAAGDINITLLGAGNLAGQGAIQANAGANNVSLVLCGTGNVTLNGATNRVVGNLLTVNTTSGRIDLNSAVNTVAATANDFGLAINQTQGLTVNQITVDGNVNIALSAGDLQIDSGSILGAQLNNITLNAAAGSINSVDLSSTGSAGVVFANVLDIRANSSSNILTSITTLGANVTGAAQSLTVTDQDDPTDALPDGLTIGANGVLTNGGDVILNVMTVDNGGNLSTAVANLGGTGNITTLNTTTNVAGNITLNVANGAATFTTRAGQLTGNVLAVSVVNTSSLNTNVTTLDQYDPGNSAVAISGANQILTINELADLEVGPGNIIAANGSDITLNVGGNLTISATGGAVMADDGTTLGNVTLNVANGAIGTPTDRVNVSGNVLQVAAQNDTYLNTTVTALNATVTVGQIDVTEANNLTIVGVSANGVRILATGAIDGTGVISSANGAGNVTLNADNITLVATNQVIGNVLNVTVVNSSTLNTRVNTLSAAVTGSGENLTISEANDLVINNAIGGVTANGGTLNLAIRSGNLTGDGAINADTGNVVLNATITNLTGTVTGNVLDVRGHRANVVTNITSLTANTSGWLTVTELNNLDIAASNVTSFGNVSITAGNATTAGTINGSGIITSTAGTVLLTTVNGAVNLNQVAGQIVGASLVLNASDSSNINTKVATLSANITGANNNLVVNEVDSLAIGGAGVVTQSGDITMNIGGDLSRGGPITAGTKAPNAGADVTLTINGATTGTGLITADTLTLTAVNSSSVNTAINTIIATITRDGQSLSVYETAGLNVAGGNVSTNNGAITLNVATGNLNITGALTAGQGNVTLNVPAGGINATAGNISGNVLNVTAANTSRLETTVNTVVGNITGAGNVLNIVESDNLAIGTFGLRTNNGAINVTVGNGGSGSLTLGNPVNAGTANVILSAANGAIAGTGNGLVTGNVLNVTVDNSSTLFTNVSTLVGAITGTNQTLSVTETANGLAIGSANLSATGPGSGLNVTVANGSLTGSGNITAVSGPIDLTVSSGNLTTTGRIDAGTGNVSLNVSGVVTLNAANQVAGNVLTLTAGGVSNLVTAVNAVSANITGAGNALIVTDTDGLSVLGAVTNAANISLTAGKDSAGNLAINGAVSAGNKTVSLLAANGAITTAGGSVTATNLTVVAANGASLNTSVSNLAANITGAGGALAINETSGLNVANVTAVNGTTINGVRTNNGDISLNLAAGNLAGAGAINAGANGNLTLTATGGAVTLNGTKQVTGNVLSVTAQNSSQLNTDVKSLGAAITGAGQTLTVTENAGLILTGISTNNASLSITTATGTLSGVAPVDAGTGNVTLVATVGNITLNGTAGQISGNLATINSKGDAFVSTNVTSLTSTVSAGNLVVNEVSGLIVDTKGVSASGNVTLNVALGNLGGAGTVNSTGASVNLAAPAGTIVLTGVNQVSAANLLTVTAGGTSALNTSVANLTATVANGGLTLTQTKNLNIVAPGIDTNLGNGSVAVTLTNGNLGGAGVINAGLGNVAINAVNGSVALNSVSPLPQIVGNVLTLSTRSNANVDTNVNSLVASVSSSGNLTVREIDNLSVNLARTFNGAVNISTSNASTLSVYNITANSGATGSVTLAAGNVLVYAPGIRASGNLNISGVGNTSVINGTIVAANTTQTTPVNWTINGNANGAGSLNDVINNINNFNGTSAVNVTTPTTVNLVGQLPAIRRSMNLAGNGNLTINGAGAGATASGLILSANGITISGITLRNFGGAAIDMLSGSTNASVSNMTVLNSAIGVRATGVQTNSVVTTSTFDGLGRANSNGALLSGAQGLSLGLNTTSFNTFRNHAVGLTATGGSAGTTVYGNTFESNSRYGVSLAAATGLAVGHPTNLSLRNTISGGAIGVFASGFCTGSSVNRMNFVNFTGTKYSVAQSRNLVIVQ